MPHYRRVKNPQAQQWNTMQSQHPHDQYHQNTSPDFGKTCDKNEYMAYDDSGVHDSAQNFAQTLDNTYVFPPTN